MWRSADRSLGPTDSIAVLESVARQLLRSGFTSIVVLLDHSLVAQFKAAIAGPTAASTAQNASRYNFAELVDVLIVLTNSAGDQSTFRSLDAATGIVAVVDGINSYRIVNGAVSSTVAVAPNTPIQPDTLVGSGNILISTSNILALLANQIQQYSSLSDRSAAGNQPDAASLLRNITTDAAARLGLTHRGVIEDGSFADLILVKVPSHINQNSILTSFLLAPSAVAPTIKAVVKNGRFVYVDDEFAEILKVARLSHYYRYGSTYSLAAGFDGVGHVNSDCVFDTVESAIEAFTIRENIKWLYTEIDIGSPENGEYLVVLDSEDRENEGDLIIAAEDFTPEKAAFMIRYTSGLICAPATGDILDRLELPLMVKNNTESLKTAYTISLDKKQGTTTGISASDRSATVMHMANPTSTAAEFSRPGHIFPLRSVPGGVLQRVGHTEAATDLCILSGKKPVAAICEIVLDNGKMARRDDLRAFSDRFGFKMITIDDLVKYRRQHGI
eukprot:jgi/Hompol1/1810/HPOL_001617-RA